MVKTISIDGNFIKTKCAEVYYQNEQFLIECTFCELSLPSYSEFLNHFGQTHHNLVENLRLRKKSTEQPCLDPLDFSNYDEEIVENEIDADIQNLCANVHNKNTLNIQNNLNIQLKKHQIKSDAELIPKELTVFELNNNGGERIDLHTAKGTRVDYDIKLDQNFRNRKEKCHYKRRNTQNICIYCNRTFQRRYQLDTHLNIHTGAKPHQCEICGRQFRAVTTLMRHLNTHVDRELFNCKFCAKVFRHKVALISHELRHTQERNYLCTNCGKKFYTENQMDTHKRKIHNVNDDDSLPFACNICPKRYRSASMLSTHKFKKHYKTAKFTCDKCEKRFIDENHLNAHNIVHFGKMKESIL